MPVMGRCVCLLTDGASEGAGRRCLCVTLYSFVRSFVGARWPRNLSALQPLAAWRGGGIQGPRGAGGLAQAVKVRPLVRVGGEGATPR